MPNLPPPPPVEPDRWKRYGVTFLDAVNALAYLDRVRDSPEQSAVLVRTASGSIGALSWLTDTMPPDVLAQTALLPRPTAQQAATELRRMTNTDPAAEDRAARSGAINALGWAVAGPGSIPAWWIMPKRYGITAPLIR